MRNLTLEQRNHLAERDRDRFITRAKVILAYLAAPLVIGFSAVDRFFKPDLVSDFLVARLIVIPLSLICWNLYKVKYVRERYYDLPIDLAPI